MHAKANVFKINPFWIQTHTSSQLKPFSALICPPTTNQVSKKDSRRLKPWDFYALTLQEQLWNRTFTSSNHVSVLEPIQNVWLRHSCQTSDSQKDNKGWGKESERRPKDTFFFVTQYHPAVPNLIKTCFITKILHLIQNRKTTSFQRSTPDILWKGKIPQRHAREGKALKRSNNAETRYTSLNR